MKRILIGFLLTVSVTACYSQVNNDTLKQILSSKTFTLVEDYTGDWGGYIYNFTFTVQDKSVRIFWDNPERLKNGQNLDLVVPISKLDSLKDIFVNCNERIKTSKSGSTEHIVYTFKSKGNSYKIDDKFTMECYEDFKMWKEVLLAEWEKQKK